MRLKQGRKDKKHGQSSENDVLFVKLSTRQITRVWRATGWGYVGKRWKSMMYKFVAQVNMKQRIQERSTPSSPGQAL